MLTLFPGERSGPWGCLLAQDAQRTQLGASDGCLSWVPVCILEGGGKAAADYVLSSRHTLTSHSYSYSAAW